MGQSAKRICPISPVLCLWVNLSATSQSACDKRQNLLCKGNDNAACKGQKTVRPLGRVVGFQRQANLHDAEAEHNHADSPYQTENEIREVVDYLNGVVSGKGGHGCAKHHREGKHRHAVAAETRSDLARHGQLRGCFLLGVLFVENSHR